MPFSVPWDETQPPGTAPANTLDTIIQQLKRDIRERMNTLISDWTTDPLTGVPRCLVRLATNQSLPNGAPTAISFTDADINYPGNALWSATAPTRITIPTSAKPTDSGPWLIGGCVLFDSQGGTTERSVGVRKNGTTFLQARVIATAGLLSVSVATIAYLNAGDYVELIALQSSGAALNALPTYSPMGGSVGTYAFAMQVT